MAAAQNKTDMSSLKEKLQRLSRDPLHIVQELHTEERTGGQIWILAFSFRIDWHTLGVDDDRNEAFLLMDTYTCSLWDTLNLNSHLEFLSDYTHTQTSK